MLGKAGKTVLLAMVFCVGIGGGAVFAQNEVGDGGAAAETQTITAPTAKAVAPRDPNSGAVTSLPIPRFVTLKSGEGNARRGPGLTHRIDWVFTRAGMPLKITGEYENWRRVEDQEGLGGWVHYSLLSGVRSVLVVVDRAQFHDKPEIGAQVAFEAERNVIGKLLECTKDWCRVSTSGDKGWIQKTALWGVDPDEILN